MEEKECIGDVMIKMSRNNAYPDSYLFQGNSVEVNWQKKRGKVKLAHYDHESFDKLKQFFKELD